MMKHLFFGLLSLFTPMVFADVNHYFDEIKNDPNALYAFFKEMPKGGELHYHFSGGIYAETLLKLAAQGNYCFNQTSYTMEPVNGVCNGLLAKELYAHPDLVGEIIRQWSMLGANAKKGEKKGEHFFSIFGKINPLIVTHQPQILADIIERAAQQRELYLEIILDSPPEDFSSFGELIKNTPQLAEKQTILLNDKKFQDSILRTIDGERHLLTEAHKLLGCDTSPQQTACSVTVKFQYYVFRNQPLDQLFAQALNLFAAAAQGKNVVGVNLVQAENGAISLRDYHQQMNIFQFMHHAYPAVHIALHAGELTQQSVNPAALRFHIREAIEVGQAERIGHGVSIAYENGAEELLYQMAKKNIPVEVNLSSNQQLLNVSGRQHPLRYYLSHQVPVVLSTDDEGIFRTDLTNEYVKAVIEQGLDYQAIKMITRNALTYNFLPGRSIWANAKTATPVPECESYSSPSCYQFIKENEKAKLQWILERQLIAFENTMESN